MSPELSHPLVTLSTGQPGLRASIQVEVSVPSSPSRLQPAPSQSPGGAHDTSPGPGRAATAALGPTPPNVHSLSPSDLSRRSPRAEADGERAGVRGDSSDSQPSSLNSQHTLVFVSSDSTLDRYGEIITPAGWRLDTYRRNPVFQNAHQYGDIIFTLGRATETEVRTVAGRQVLYQHIEFAVDANPMAKIAHALYRGKFLNAVSVGFVPIHWEDNPGGRAAVSLSSTGGEAHGEEAPCRRRYLEQELLEVSAVAIPANPNALALAYKSGALEKSDVQNTIDVLRQTISVPNLLARRSLGEGGQPSTCNLEPTLSHLRQLRDLLKH